MIQIPLDLLQTDRLFCFSHCLYLSRPAPSKLPSLLQAFNKVSQRQKKLPVITFRSLSHKLLLLHLSRDLPSELFALETRDNRVGEGQKSKTIWTGGSKAFPKRNVPSSLFNSPSSVLKLLPPMQPLKTKKFLAAERYLQGVKSRFINQPERYTKFCQELRGISSQIIEKVDNRSGSVKIYFEGDIDDAVERLKATLEGHNDLILGLNSFLPNSLLVDDNDNALVDGVARRQAEERVIELRSDQLDCIIQKSSGHTEASKTEYPRITNYGQIGAFGTKDSEETNGDGLNGEELKGESLSGQWCRFLTRVDEKLPNLERRIKFMRHLDNFHIGLINKAELDMGVVSMIGVHRDLMEEFNCVLSRYINFSPVKANVKSGEKRKLEYFRKERPTPSSRKRQSKRNHPSGDELPSVRHQGKRSHQSDDVSNDLFECKSSSKMIDGKSTKDHRCREKIKFKIEDFLNEVDVLLCWLKGAIDFATKNEEDWYDENYDGTIKKISFRRCVERMYGEHAMDVLRMFEENPQHTLPIIIPQLVKKEKELADHRKILEKNIWKSKRLRQQLGIEEQDIPATAPNGARKIANSSVNANTRKPRNYQESGHDGDVVNRKSVPEIEPEVIHGGQMMTENNSIVVAQNQSVEPPTEMQKASQKTVLSAPGLYTAGRPLEEDDADSRTIFVSNVHFAATKDSLSWHFNQFGDVLEVIIVTDPATGEPKGSAYVEFIRKEAADNALSLDGTSFMSRILKILKRPRRGTTFFFAKDEGKMKTPERK